MNRTAPRRKGTRDVHPGLKKQLASLGFWQDAMKVDAAEELHKAMKEQGMSQSALARKVGCSRAYINKVLAGTTNFTLESLAELFWAVGRQISLDVKTKK